SISHRRVCVNNAMVNITHSKLEGLLLQDTQIEWEAPGLVPPEKIEGQPLLKLCSPLDIKKERVGAFKNVEPMGLGTSSDNNKRGLDTSCASGMAKWDIVSPNCFAVLEDPKQEEAKMLYHRTALSRLDLGPAYYEDGMIFPSYESRYLTFERDSQRGGVHLSPKLG
ncbi:hypothetical protein HAX54_017863, partial [Datura stramonium]|nr:hypothetical protein [Datura stramonium]